MKKKKECFRCNIEKDAREFGKNNHSRDDDGLNSWCRDCVVIGNRIRNEKYKEARKHHKFFTYNSYTKKYKVQIEFEGHEELVGYFSSRQQARTHYGSRYKELFGEAPKV